MGEFSVQMTADLINQLTNGGEKAKKKPKKVKPKGQPPKVQPKVDEKQLRDDFETPKGIVSPGWPVQPPLYLPVSTPAQATNAELNAICSVVQESERVLEKLKKQEDNMVQELTERAKDLRDKEFKLPYQKPMPCMADYDACKACYMEHRSDILKCAPLTKSYYDCVSRAKQQMNSAGN